MTRLQKAALAATLPAGLAGCNRNPNIEIVGSYFPGWMVCLVFGVCLAGLAHVALKKARLLSKAGPPALLYPSLVTLFTCVLWLCFFA